MVVQTCDHGYELAAATTDCPRCADRPHVAVLGAPRHPQTRWHGSTLTFGPTVKALMTAALIIPTLLFAYTLAHAGQSLAYTFAVVPLSGFVMLDVRLLPEVWASGRRRQ
jgi:hypothetical protein